MAVGVVGAVAAGAAVLGTDISTLLAGLVGQVTATAAG